MRTLIIAAALVATPAAAATDQFDLVCTGTVKTAPRGAASAINTRYRVDLAAKSWCRDDCAEVRTIEAVTDGEIVFEQRGQDVNAQPWVRHTVDRTSGAWKDFLSTPDVQGRNVFSPGLWIDAVGACTTAPFSGFPTRRF